MKTLLLKKSINTDEAQSMFTILREILPWKEGIKSRKGFTRLACPINTGDIPLIDQMLVSVAKSAGITINNALGIYVNYYKNGEMWTPNHSHKESNQIVISLGGTRTLNVGTKSYKMSNGDAIIFGHGIHGVPKESHITEGRISIAAFFEN